MKKQSTLKLICEGCGHAVMGKTKQEVKDNAVKHAKEVHPGMLESMDKQQLNDLMAHMESKITIA